MAKAVSQRSLQGVQTGLFGSAALMIVDRDRIMRFAAEKIVNRHAGAFAFNVPERHIHGGENVVVHWPVAPVRLHLRRLPKILDAVRVFADEPRLQVVLQRCDDRFGFVVVIRRPDTV